MAETITISSTLSFTCYK